MYANLYGDFVKGRDLSAHSQFVQSGILLHREIDSYIDRHPIVIELLHHLYSSLPKVSGIAVDLYFDHLLAKNWESYHQIPYSQFLHNFYIAKIENEDEYSEEFLHFIQLLVDRDWMSHYSKFEGLTQVCRGLSARISFENTLSSAPRVFLENEDLISRTFEQFMSEGINHFRNYHAQMSV